MRLLGRAQTVSCSHDRGWIGLERVLTADSSDVADLAYGATGLLASHEFIADYTGWSGRTTISACVSPLCFL
jgi:hypothetical protein